MSVSRNFFNKVFLIRNYGDLVYKSKKTVGNPVFSNLFRNLVNHFKNVGDLNTNDMYKLY